MLIFPGVDTPANSPQGQSVQCSEKLLETSEAYIAPTEPRHFAAIQEAICPTAKAWPKVCHATAP